ncbi:MAG: Type I restriction modification DNA specificity domain protein [Pelotomaculum sp. PtaB.Bin104]|nr:MAG: Type I restriction modification DNA specificity domain protein [Pelotomaculum sp. PtaB.Bin104]
MLRPYMHYVQTQEKWIPMIPEKWNLVTVKSVLSERKEKNIPIKTDFILSLTAKQGVIPYNEKKSGGNKAKEDISKYNIAHKNDLLVNCMNVVSGSSGISNYYGAISPVYYALYVRNNDANIRYCEYIFRNSLFYSSLVGLGNGILMKKSSSGKLNTVRKRIPMNKLNRVMIPLPPRSEQDQIVRFLDWKTTEIARYIKEKKEEIAYLTELKNSLIFHAVTKGCRPTVTKTCQQKWIGDIPAHWEEKMLFQCATEQNISNKNIHNQNLLSLSYGKIVNKDINTTTGLLPASFDTYQIIHDGNIILRLTDLQNDHRSLRVGLSTQTGIITSAYTCLKPRAHVLPEYLYLLLHSYDVCKLFYGMGGGVRQSIGYNDIRRMIVLLPPKEEQEEIVTYCHGVQTKIDLLIDSIKNEISYLGELRTKTIADVVTGKVDIRSVIIPEYEMATYAEIDEDIDEDTTDDESEEEILDEEVDD